MFSYWPSYLSSEKAGFPAVDFLLCFVIFFFFFNFPFFIYFPFFSGYSYSEHSFTNPHLSQVKIFKVQSFVSRALFFEIEVVLKSVKRYALNDDREGRCPSRRLKISASNRMLLYRPLVFIYCSSSSNLLEVVRTRPKEYARQQFLEEDTTEQQVF